MLFEVGDFGTVDEHNAVFAHFLERLVRADGEGDDYPRLENIPVGRSVVGHFRTGMGWSFTFIHRLS